MSEQTPRAVYDCNIFLQAILNPRGPAGECVARALDGKIAVFVTDYLLAELRDMQTRPKLAKMGLTSERTELLIENVLKVATLVPSVPEVFTYERDPDDGHYVNLALAADAKLIVSRDRDLLDLSGTSKDAVEFQRTFPGLRVLDPIQFLCELDSPE